MSLAHFEIMSIRTKIADETLGLEAIVRPGEYPRPILWEREGLFRLIPLSIVNNVLIVYENQAKMSNNSPPTIRWEQGVDVDPKIARILLGE